MDKLKGMLKAAFNRHTSMDVFSTALYGTFTALNSHIVLVGLFGALTAGAVNRWRASATGRHFWEPKIIPQMGL